MEGYLLNFQGRGVFSPDGKSETYPAGVDAHNARVAEAEQTSMEATGRGILYLTTDPKGDLAEVSNWIGTLKIPCRARKGRHNIAGCRVDVWFVWHGDKWHGIQLGRWSQIVRCKRLAK